MAVVRSIQTTVFGFKNKLFCGVCNFRTLTESRNPLIAFPKRPSIDKRYSIKEEVLQVEVPDLNLHTNSPLLSQKFKAKQKSISPESATPGETIYKSDGSAIYITDYLPLKYKRPLISNEEIEYIMRGGPDR